MPSLAEQFNAIPVQSLRLDDWLIVQSKDDVAAFESAVANPGIPIGTIVTILRKAGCAVTPETLKARRDSVTR